MRKGSNYYILRQWHIEMCRMRELNCVLLPDPETLSLLLVSRTVATKNGGGRLEYRQPHTKIVGRYVNKRIFLQENFIASFL